MNWFTLPWRNFIRRPMRSSLAVAGIAIAIANFVAIIALARGIPYAVEHSLDETGADFIVSARNSFMLLSGSVPEQLGQKIDGVPEVASAAPVLFNIISVDDEINIPVVGWDKDSALWRNLKLTAGRLPAAGDDHAILLGDNIAAALKKTVGDTIELNYRPFRIVGIARFESIFNQNLAVTDLHTLQQLLGRNDSVSFFQVMLKRPLIAQDIERARMAIARAVGDFAVQNTGTLSRNLTLLKLIVVAASAISFVAVAVAMLGVANTLLMAVNERIGEIGILRAIGWQSSRIMAIILAEGVVTSVIGGLIGIGLGIIDVYIVADLPLTLGLLDPDITWGLLTQALVLAILVGAVGAVIPARRAVRISAAEALRYV